MTTKKTVGDRLKEERLRLKLSQEAFGLAGGVGKNAQIKYEKGERTPDAEYLQGIHAAGADILYVVAEVRRLDLIDSDVEREMLRTVIDQPSSRIGQAFSKLYDRAVAAGINPNTLITERHAKLVTAFDKATESGRKMIERVAQLEAARSKPKSSQKVSIHGVDIIGDGNVIGNNNKVKK